jgi:hypothetical protein
MITRNRDDGKAATVFWMGKIREELRSAIH